MTESRFKGNRLPPTLVAAGLLIASAAATAQKRPAAAPDPMAGFDQYVTEAMKQWKVPGLAIAAVRGDSVVFAKGYGVRTLGDPAPVDPQTMFAMRMLGWLCWHSTGQWKRPG